MDQPPKSPFHEHGGIMYRKHFERHVGQLPLTRTEKEYVKRVYEKYEGKLSEGKKGVTEGEFMKGLDEMAKNERDPITREEIERIQRHF